MLKKIMVLIGLIALSLTVFSTASLGEFSIFSFNSSISAPTDSIDALCDQEEKDAIKQLLLEQGNEDRFKNAIQILSLCRID